MEDLTGMLDDNKLVLNTGDTMLLYTDGITEAIEKSKLDMSKSDESMFGDDRVEKILFEKGAGPAKDVKQALLDELKDYITDDDVTMLIIKKDKLIVY